MTQRRGISGGGKGKSPPEIFTGKVFEALASDLQSGRTPLKRTTITDPLTTGLSVIIRNTGLISFHAHYEIDESRPLLKIGDYPERTVEEARKLARTIRILAQHGIDVQDGLHDRLMRELLAKGDKWRP